MDALSQSPITDKSLGGLILIVDDNPFDSDAACLWLTEAGRDEGLDFRFHESASGHDGLAACRSEMPSCILLGSCLPDMDGLEFLARLKDDLGEVLIPVVMLTEASNQAHPAAALRAGAQECLPKQFMRSQMLLRAVQSAQDRFVMFAGDRQAAAEALREREALFMPPLPA